MGNYQHTLDQQAVDLPIGKVVCVGRNYAEHAKELNNPVPSSPILFIKPSTAITPFENSIQLPENVGSCHHELEIAILIGKPLKNCSLTEATDGILGYGLALDLTLRDLQNSLKEKGHPWERAKAFDGSCPLSTFIGADLIPNMANIELCLHKNDKVQQKGNSSGMVTAIDTLISYISQSFTLLPGDVVLTGTPAGVSALASGDTLHATLNKVLSISTRVA